MADPNYDQALSEISLILQTAGYDCEAEEGPFNLSGVKGNKCIIVLCSDDMNALQRFDMTPYTINIGGSKIRCDKLIFSVNSSFKPKESLIWSKEKLLGLIAAAAEARIFAQPFSLDAAPVSYAGASVQPDPSGNSTLQMSMMGLEQMLPVKIDARGAARVCHEEGPSRLKLIPYWRYEYTSGGSASYKGKEVKFDGQGYGWINAVNNLEWEFGADAMPQPSEIPRDAEIVSATTQQKDVEETIMQLLIKKLTKHLRLKVTSGDAIFAEEKEFIPTPENISLKVTKVYVPVWEIRGKKDIVEVNAFDGQELAVPSDEGCEVF
ncbi:MAG TPA: hypothetical protein O0X27_00765 [Methanocorpusculum sp.]|nr:hypothetical protein [Methanocorpusculum sp.]